MLVLFAWILDIENSKTPLIQACRSGHWEVVQTLLAFGCNVWRADGLSGRTALHVAAAGGHVRCVRLLLAGAGAGDDEERIRYVNKAAGGGGVTALHLAALQGHVECVHLLADERARLDAQTLPCAAAPMASVGAGSTPLHYAASGGEVKCCQILVSRGADRMAVNSNGWLPVDVARIFARNWLEHVLSPKSPLSVPKFPPSPHLSLPLPSLLAIAADHAARLLLTTTTSVAVAGEDEDDKEEEEEEACSVCLERPCTVAAEVCGHELCLKCALDLSTVMKAYEVPGLAGAVPCPLCRSGIASFRKAAAPDDDDNCGGHKEAPGGGQLEEEEKKANCAHAPAALHLAPFAAAVAS